MSLQDKIKELLPGWLNQPSLDGDVVLSCRIRLARNLREIPFPHYAGEKQLEEVNNQIKNVLELPDSEFKDYSLVRIDGLGQLDRILLVEKYLVSPDLINKPAHRGVVIKNDETAAIMINEEDHLRIQTIFPGLQLEKAWNLANKIDDSLEAHLNFAFDEEKGYLTTCPTNAGTGLRASVMLHLPALAMVDQVKKVLSVLPHVGLNVRGIYGEGTDPLGNIYQISNQVALGLSEEDLIGKLVSVTRQVIDQERSAREALLTNDSRLPLENRVNRAFGLLTHARLVSSEETIRLFNDVLLGAQLNLIPEVKEESIRELLFLNRPAILQHLIGKELTPGERDYYRAAVVRDHLKKRA